MIKQYKKVASLIISICILLPTGVALGESSSQQVTDINATPVVPNKIFQDVGNHWAATAIYNMTQMGIINGYDDNTFKPGNKITREEFAALLTNTFSLEREEITSRESTSFQDVQVDRWSFLFIEAAREIFPKLTNEPSGDKSLYFKPAQLVTREEFISAIVKALGYSGQNPRYSGTLRLTFGDAEQIDDEYMNDVAVAIDLKLVQGQVDGTFAPKDTISRAEVASILYRAIQLSTAQEAELAGSVTVNVPDKTTKGNIEISGSVPTGTEVTVNGYRLEVKDKIFSGRLHMFQEGSYSITIALKMPYTRVHFIRKQISYIKASPKISLHRLVDTATGKNSVTLRGIVSYEEASEYPSLFINGEKTEVYSNGEFSVDKSLEEGANSFILKAVGKDGQYTELLKEILYVAPAPVITLGQIPSTTKSNVLTITGTVKDINDKNLEETELYIQGAPVEFGVLGSFSYTINLNKGDNIIHIIAQNKFSKAATIVKAITLESSD